MESHLALKREFGSVLCSVRQRAHRTDHHSVENLGPRSEFGSERHSDLRWALHCLAQRASSWEEYCLDYLVANLVQVMERHSQQVVRSWEADLAPH